MLTKISNKLVPSMGLLHQMALKYIFDKKNFTDNERRVMEEAIVDWSHKVNLDRDEKIELARIINAIEADERDAFARFKWLIEKDRLDYRLLFKAGLPFVKGINEINA